MGNKKRIYTKYTDKLKAEAREMYVSGMSYNEIARKLDLNVPHLSKIGKRENWPSDRAEVAIRVKKEILDSVKDREIEHISMYQEMEQVGRNALTSEGILVRDAGQAASILDTGIKGERAVTGGLLELKFVMEVLKVLHGHIPEEYFEVVRNRLGLLVKEYEKKG